MEGTDTTGVGKQKNFPLKREPLPAHLSSRRKTFWQVIGGVLGRSWNVKLRRKPSWRIILTNFGTLRKVKKAYIYLHNIWFVK
ncbi:hypothetical protein AKJ41_00185 [candidate division MSBL1 archaeon SCGC-AAA259O05]|uniref:Uncharacterized protein n=1 Tax=candidate division MSBL1 archaeon SCGC-AAA259O05 TaxID=1698271 RepID=A0A133V5V1_9EURY|nr:hypothetical protein AKJ41_00185 [candidate division MSBL1 archaeon SCGC-AAA259O05]